MAMQQETPDQPDTEAAKTQETAPSAPAADAQPTFKAPKFKHAHPVEPKSLGGSRPAAAHAAQPQPAAGRIHGEPMAAASPAAKAPKFVDYKIAFQRLMPADFYEQVKAAHSEFNLPEHQNNFESLRKAFIQLTQVAKKLPDETKPADAPFNQEAEAEASAHARSPRALCALVALSFARDAVLSNAQTLEKSMCEFACLEFAASAKTSMFPELIAQLRTIECILDSGRQATVEDRLLAMTKKIAKLPEGEHTEAEINLMRLLIAAVDYRACLMRNDEKEIAELKKFIAANKSALSPAQLTMFNSDLFAA